MPFVKKETADIAYRSGNPLMSDKDYDEKFGINASDMDTPDFENKTKHKCLMHSLKKIKIDFDGDTPDLSKLFSWMGDNLVVASWKYDGIAVELQYENGKFDKAVTRGDGHYGEEITKNVMKMNNFVSKISNMFSGSVKAEIVMCHDDFKEYLETTNDKKPYDNPRNGASGAARESTGRNCKFLTLKCYGIEMNPYCVGDIDTFMTLEGFGFKDVHYKVIKNHQELAQTYTDMLTKRNTLNFEVDGIVLSIESADEKEELGFSGGRPNYRIAAKFPPQSKVTKIKDIVWQVGKSGHITPVAVIEPADLGVKVGRATLANMNKMNELKVHIGDFIIVSRRGDVIPHVEKNLTEHENYRINYPKQCPVCENDTFIDGAFLICSNIDCEARKIGDINHWLRKIKDHYKIHCMGPETVDQLFEKGIIEDVPDLYELTTNMLIENLDRCGIASASNMLRFQLYKKIPLKLFLDGLNVPDIGGSIWEWIINAGYDSIEKIEGLTIIGLANEGIEGISELRAESIVAGFQDKLDLVHDLICVGVEPFFEKSKAIDSPITGKVFVITGTLTMDRSQMEGIIKQYGGIVKSGISKKVDYLVIGKNVGATKTNKADKLGVPMITEDEFNRMLECENE